MPEYLVLLLVQITIFSSVTAVLLLAVKWLFRRRIPPVLSLMLWLILFVRVMLPMLPESALSIYNLIPAGREILYTLTHDYESVGTETAKESELQENPYLFYSTEKRDISYGTAPEEAGAAEESVQHQVDALKNREILLHYMCVAVLAVYGCGIFLTGIMQFWIYGRAIRRVYRNSSLCTDPVILQIYTETAAGMRIMDRKAPPLRLGSTTMLAGLFKPCVILCPEDAVFSGQQESEERTAGMRMIFVHELNHFKHRDNWILLLSTLVCILFWFNPLLWLVRNMLREDIEVLCDARTLENWGIEDSVYARMLCRSSRLPEMIPEAGTAMSASGRKLKLRLMHISSRRKGTFLPRWISVVLCAAMIALCLTNPMVSAENAYAPYISRVAAMTGESVRDITLAERVTVGQFLNRLHQMLAYAGDESLSSRTGGGNLASMLRLAAQSPYLSAETVEALQNLTMDSPLTVENCALLLACLTGLLGEGRFVQEMPVLPEMLTADMMDSICRNLTREEAELFRTCYNVGTEGAAVVFSHVYTEAMMKLILSRVQDTWSRGKLAVYYQKVNLSADKLDEINAYLGNTVRYVGIDRDFYICDPTLSGQEEETLRKILGAAYAGEREDMYYLKKTEDGCSFAKAAEMLAETGITWADIHDNYAIAGETTYTYTPDIDFIHDGRPVWISAHQLETYVGQIEDPVLIDSLQNSFTYHNTFTYTDTDGSSDTISMRYYTAEPENAETCREILQMVTDHMNRAAFTLLNDTEQVYITDAMYPTVESACLLAAKLGIMSFGNRIVSVQRQITSGQCAQILCRFLASMTNAK